MHQNLKVCVLDVSSAEAMHDLGGQVFYTTSEKHGRLPRYSWAEKQSANYSAAYARAKRIFEDPTAVFFFVY
ncbi:MAG: hypothetical protein WCH05_10020 [Chlorobiaceae bacterium]